MTVSPPKYFPFQPLTSEPCRVPFSSKGLPVHPPAGLPAFLLSVCVLSAWKAFTRVKYNGSGRCFFLSAICFLLLQPGEVQATAEWRRLSTRTRYFSQQPEARRFLLLGLRCLACTSKPYISNGTLMAKQTPSPPRLSSGPLITRFRIGRSSASRPSYLADIFVVTLTTVVSSREMKFRTDGRASKQIKRIKNIR